MKKNIKRWIPPIVVSLLILFFGDYIKSFGLLIFDKILSISNYLQNSFYQDLSSEFILQSNFELSAVGLVTLIFSFGSYYILIMNMNYEWEKAISPENNLSNDKKKSFEEYDKRIRKSRRVIRYATIFFSLILSFFYYRSIYYSSCENHVRRFKWEIIRLEAENQDALVRDLKYKWSIMTSKQDYLEIEKLISSAQKKNQD